MNKNYITILFFFFSGELVYSAVQDSLNPNTDSSTIHFFYCGSRVFDKKHLYSDTTLSKFHIVLPIELRGGIVEPFEVYRYEGHKPTVGFNSGFSNFDQFNFGLDSMKFFTTRTPYTDLKLVFSSKKEQYFKLLHTQNINKNMNFAIQVLRTNGEGFYLRQNAVSNNANVSINYLSWNNRYSVLMTGIIKSFKKDENGGISNDSIVESNILSDKKLFGVNLIDARTRRGVQEIYLKQFLFFGPSEEIKKGDSLYYKRRIPKSYISHSIQYCSSWFVYADKMPQSGFYGNIFLDSISTFDSTYLNKIENEINFGTLDNCRIKNLKNINFEMGMKHQYVIANQLGRDSIFNDLVIKGSILTKQIESKNGFLLKGNYYFEGDHSGDYDVCASVTRNLGLKTGSITFDASIKNSSPDYVYTSYRSNNFMWYNNFEKILQRNIRLSSEHCHGKYWRAKVDVGLNSIFNYTYFDSTFLPKQFNSNINIISATFIENFDFKHWHFHNKILYQKSGGDDILKQKIYPPIPDRQTVLRLPSVVGIHSFYYSGKWFKKVMDVQLGLDIFYFSSYYGDAYMPALGMFYIQNQKQVGNYPFADLFFNFKVKRARVFFKVEHFASGLVGSNYYLAPHYMANDRQLRFGLSWRFFD